MPGLRQTRGVSLEGLRDRIAALQSPAFRARLAQQLGEEARTQVADCFREERDPYGNAWEPLKYRKGKILRDTGRMAAAVAVQQTANGFRIDIPVKYAPFHQEGTRPFAVRARQARQNARGRFVGRGARTAYLLKLRAHTNPGIARRQMLPEKDTGGLGPIWGPAFNKAADGVIGKYLRGR